MRVGGAKFGICICMPVCAHVLVPSILVCLMTRCVLRRASGVSFTAWSAYGSGLISRPGRVCGSAYNNHWDPPSYGFPGQFCLLRSGTPKLALPASLESPKRGMYLNLDSCEGLKGNGSIPPPQTLAQTAQFMVHYVEVLARSYVPPVKTNFEETPVGV